jgi:hypothetical protein
MLSAAFTRWQGLVVLRAVTLVAALEKEDAAALPSMVEQAPALRRGPSTREAGFLERGFTAGPGR